MNGCIMNYNLSKYNYFLNKARKLLNQNKINNSIEFYNFALNEKPNCITCLNELGVIYINLAKYNEADKIYSNYIANHAGDFKTFNHYSIVLMRTGRINEALYYLDLAYKLNPFCFETLLNLCALNNQIGNLDTAFNFALEAIKVNPTSSLAHNNLGSVFNSMAMRDEALYSFETALSLDSNNLESYVNIGAIKSSKFDVLGSIEIYEKAIIKLNKLHNKQVEIVKYFLSFEYFKNGEIKNGWKYFESGFHPNIPIKNGRAPRRTFSKPLWNGSSLIDKNILVWREQGLGDELMFFSMLPDLLSIVKNVIIEVDGRLVNSFQRSFPNVIVRAQSFGSPPNNESNFNDFDFHIPVASLGGYLRSDVDSFKNSKPYIIVDREKKFKFHNRLLNFAGHIKIGISWRSGTIDPLRNLTYLSIFDLECIFSIKNAIFINLQYGDCDEECSAAEIKFGIKIIRWSDLNLKDDLDDVFSLISELDYVVTVATAVQHMAASVGAVTLLITPRGAWNRFNLDYDPWFSNLHPFVSDSDDLRTVLPNVKYYIESRI